MMVYATAGAIQVDCPACQTKAGRACWADTFSGPMVHERRIALANERV